MPLSSKALRRRLRTVKSTQKITRAMETVSAVKLRRAQDRLMAARPHARKLAEVIRALADDETAQRHRLCTARPVRRRTLIVVAADRGLCGAFNANVFRAADQFLAEHTDTPVEIVAVGRRAVAYHTRRGHEVVESVAPLGGLAETATSARLAQAMIRRFTAEQTDEVWLLATHMVSLIRFVPMIERLLPLDLGRAADRPGQIRLNYLFEPSAETVLETLLPRTVESRVHHALAESVASEHSARRIAMHNATDNCKDLSQTLTLQINKARQAAITKELLEIVGGAEALKS